MESTDMFSEDFMEEGRAEQPADTGICMRSGINPKKCYNAR